MNVTINAKGIHLLNKKQPSQRTYTYHPAFTSNTLPNKHTQHQPEGKDCCLQVLQIKYNNFLSDIVVHPEKNALICAVRIWTKLLPW